MGNAIAFNAKRKGVLSYVNMENTLSNANSVNTLYSGMKVNEYEEEKWYGDPNKVAKMIEGNYSKQFYNNLKALQWNNSTNINPNFNLASYNKLVTKVEP